MMNAVIVICTRPDSRRLQGKSIIPVAGRRAIRHILERVKNTYPVILAVPYGCEEYREDSMIYGAEIFQGLNDDPLRRMVEAVRCSKKLKEIPDYVIRITHDDLLIDAKEMIEMVKATEAAQAGYGYSAGILDGAGVEAIAWKNLLAASTREKRAVEHISYFVRGMSPNTKIVAHVPRAEICRPYRMTMDYPEDLTAIELTLRKLGSDASVDEICQFLDMNPQVTQINRKPILSVYTCAKDAEEYVEKAIESAMMNSYSDMEYIFVDDGSTDDTALLAAKYVSDKANPFKLFLNEYNMGLASSSNRAIGEARGEYVLRLDADDMLSPTAIQTLVDEIERTGADIVYPDYRVIGDALPAGCQLGQIKSGRIHHHAGGAIMRRQFINALWFKEGLKWWDSLELYHRAKEVGKIAYLKEPVFFYRQHNTNLTKQDPIARQKAAKALGLVPPEIGLGII